MSVFEILKAMFPGNPLSWLCTVLAINLLALYWLRQRK